MLNKSADLHNPREPPSLRASLVWCKYQFFLQCVQKPVRQSKQTEVHDLNAKGCAEMIFLDTPLKCKQDDNYAFTQTFVRHFPKHPVPVCWSSPLPLCLGSEYPIIFRPEAFLGRGLSFPSVLAFAHRPDILALSHNPTPVTQIHK